MRKTFWYVLGGQLATISIPAIAQDGAQVPPADPMPDGSPAFDLTPEQMAAYGGWPAERQAQFDSWPNLAKSYFWTLRAERQEIFWRLTDSDRLALVGMTEEQRAGAWEMIEAKVAGDAAESDSVPDTEPGEAMPDMEEPALPDDKPGN